MNTVFLASLRTHVRRYVAAMIAVTIGTAFIVMTGVLAAGGHSAVMAGFGAPYRNADHVVSHMDTEDAIALAERLGANAAAVGRAKLSVRAGGRLSTETAVGPIAPSAELRWQTLESGRFPAGTGEAVVDLPFAQAKGIAVGDRIQIGDGATAAEIQVVGFVGSPSIAAQASVYVGWEQLLRWREDPSLSLGSVAVRGDVGPLPPGAKVQAPQAYVQEKSAGLTSGVDTLSVMLLVFAAIALFVSILVIANTFSILFAQRLRDFALLRCVGATRRQVVRSVRREAAAVGVFASLIGILVGVGVGYGLIAVINLLAPNVPIGAAGPPTLWLLGGFVAGVAVTLVASWLPTRRVVRVSPLEALRPDAAIDVHTATGMVRLVLAALFLVVGLALLGVAMIRHGTPFMVVGGGSVFTGILLFGPVLIPGLIRITGRLLGPAWRLATTNAVRNPRRTATTTASLLVGITLTTAALTGLATTQAAVDELLNRQHPLDAALNSPQKEVTTDLLDRVRHTRGVARAVAVDGAVASVDGLAQPIPVLAASAVAQVARDGGAFAQVDPGTIKLDQNAFGKDLTLRSGDRVTVHVGDRRAQLRVALGRGWGQSGLVAPETLATLTTSPQPYAVWVRAYPGTGWSQLNGDLYEVAYPIGAEIENGLWERSTAEQEVTILTWSTVGLLGIAVLIALIGIANTLGLSVIERAREHAMLRALGLTRKQLRRMLAAEAVLLSVVAAVLGTVMGLGFAWVGYETFLTQILTHATMRIPWLPLAVVVLIAALAGLLASVLPARRAARVTPAAGLSLE